MARKKAEGEKKTSNPVGFRISPRSAEALDAITKEFGLSKTTAIEVALIHLAETAKKGNPKRVMALIEAEKKNPG